MLCIVPGSLLGPVEKEIRNSVGRHLEGYPLVPDPIGYCLSDEVFASFGLSTEHAMEPCITVHESCPLPWCCKLGTETGGMGRCGGLCALLDLYCGCV